MYEALLAWAAIQMPSVKEEVLRTLFGREAHEQGHNEEGKSGIRKKEEV